MKYWLLGIICAVLVYVLIKADTTGISVRLPSASQAIGVPGVEPELPPDISDPSVWQSAERVCVVAPEQEIRLTEYAKEIGEEQLLSVGVLSLGDVRMAIRAGVYARAQGALVEVAHVRQADGKQWIRFNWTNPKEQEVARVQALRALHVTSEQFDECFRQQ